MSLGRTDVIKAAFFIFISRYHWHRKPSNCIQHWYFPPKLPKMGLVLYRVAWDPKNINSTRMYIMLNRKVSVITDIASAASACNRCHAMHRSHNTHSIHYHTSESSCVFLSISCFLLAPCKTYEYIVHVLHFSSIVAISLSFCWLQSLLLRSTHTHAWWRVSHCTTYPWILYY